MRQISSSVLVVLATLVYTIATLSSAQPFTSAPKTYLLIGLTGSGKSTTGNCLINQKGDYMSITQKPFATTDASTGWVRNFALANNDQFSVIDTVGFGDPKFDVEYLFKEFKFALSQVNNHIDCVLFVVQKSRFSNELVEFFKLMQERVLKGKCRDNSILLVTNCNKGWLDRKEQQKNPSVQTALNSTNQMSFEFFLKFDDEDTDNQQERQRNEERRQKAINELVEYLDGMQFKKIDLSYVQSVDFEFEIKTDFIPLMLDLFKRITKSISELKTVFGK